MCFGCSKKPSHRDGSFEYPQHTFWMRNKKNNFQLRAWPLLVANVNVPKSYILAHKIGTVHVSIESISTSHIHVHHVTSI